MQVNEKKKKEIIINNILTIRAFNLRIGDKIIKEVERRLEVPRGAHGQD